MVRGRKEGLEKLRWKGLGREGTMVSREGERTKIGNDLRGGLR